jgi:polyisoprenoid-binding protein YceI
MKRLFVPVLAAALAASTALLAQNPPPPPPTQPPTQTPAQTPAQGQQQRPPLGPNEWRIDGNHSAAHFSVRHLMVSTVRGQLGRITGTLEYDGKDVRSIQADVSIDVNGINTQNEGRDKHLRSPDFFDVATHPAITFKSKRIEPGSSGAFKMIGDLTKGQRGNLVVGASATTKIKRLEYGVKYNSLVDSGPVVGDEVTVTIDLEANRPSAPGTSGN